MKQKQQQSADANVENNDNTGVAALAMASAADPAVLGNGRSIALLAESVLGCHSVEKRNWELIRCSCLAFRRLASSVKVRLGQEGMCKLATSMIRPQACFHA